MARLTRRAALRAAAITTAVVGTTSVANSATPNVFTDGNGTEADPYVIDSERGLDAIREDLTAHYRLEQDIQATGGIETIGDRNTPFTGSFNGGGHTISGLTITTATDPILALFYTVDGGEISRLRMVDPEFEHEASGSEVSPAGIVGFNRGGTISECVFEGVLVGFEPSGITHINGGEIIDSYVVVNAGEDLPVAIAGDNTGTIARSYALIEAENNISVNVTFGDGTNEDIYWDSALADGDVRWEPTGLPTPLMTGSDAREHMNSLNFTDTWETTSGYPRLARVAADPPEPEPTAGFVVADHIPGEHSIDPGDEIEVTTTIENVGSERETTDVDLFFTGFVDGEGSDGRQDQNAVTLAPNESTTVSFDPIETDNLVDGTYRYSVRTKHTRESAKVVVGTGETDGAVWLAPGAENIETDADTKITGGTELPNDAVLEARIRSAASTHPGFIIASLQTTPDDGRWEIPVDFEHVNQGDEYEIEITHDGDTVLETEGEAIKPRPTIEGLQIEFENGYGDLETTGSTWNATMPTLDIDNRVQGDLILDGSEENLLENELVSVDVSIDGSAVTEEYFENIGRIRLLPEESGTATAEISIKVDESEVLRTPPLELTVADPETDDGDNEADEDESTGDDGAADEDENTGDGGDPSDDEASATDDVVDDETDADEPADEATGTDDEVPGFSIFSAVTALGGAAYALTRLGRDRTPRADPSRTDE